MTSKVNKICYIATIPAAVHAFLRVHIQTAATKYQVTVICNSVDKHLLQGLNARIILLPIERRPSILRDLSVLFSLYKLFRRERFDIVHSHLPKTGLLGMLAARLADIPIRINTFHGEVWATRSGWSRKLLKSFDRLVGWLATHVLAVSPSQRDFLINEGVLQPNKVSVIGNGSICGVDSMRFHSDAKTRQSLRRRFGIASEVRVILFVGRLNYDKGLLDLVAAFHLLARDYPDVVLFMVGTEESISFDRIQELCVTEQNRLYYAPFTTTPEEYMIAADIFCMPSYREGFGLAVIEAAACGVPAVASRIYGIIDAVEDGKTGLLFPPGDVDSLRQALSSLLTDKELRQKMGERAQLRALTNFPSTKIVSGMMSFYSELLAKAGK
jgi:glycosyltransferase involved in cell wall biosynthesis